MAKIFITGSADGLGHLAAKVLVKQGHQVVLHARNAARGKQALEKVPGAESVLIADLSDLDETRALAAEVNTLGTFDAVMHNAGVYNVPEKSINAQGLPALLAVNSLAPYILTALMHPPKRLIYLSSGMHLQGDPHFHRLEADGGAKQLRVSYADTKLHDLILSMAVANLWSNVFVNAVDPGWVPTRMGGPGAPGNLEKGFETQVWLAVSNDTDARVSGRYFHHKKEARYLSAAGDSGVQSKWLQLCHQLTGVRLT